MSSGVIDTKITCNWLTYIGPARETIRPDMVKQLQHYPDHLSARRVLQLV
jgi:hypothetical protein